MLIAYVSLPGNNILLGLEYDHNRYNGKYFLTRLHNREKIYLISISPAAIIDATCLRKDIDTFPDGDMTHIGERGFE